MGERPGKDIFEGLFSGEYLKSLQSRADAGKVDVTELLWMAWQHGRACDLGNARVKVFTAGGAVQELGLEEFIRSKDGAMTSIEAFSLATNLLRDGSFEMPDGAGDRVRLALVPGSLIPSMGEDDDLEDAGDPSP